MTNKQLTKENNKKNLISLLKDINYLCQSKSTKIDYNNLCDLHDINTAERYKFKNYLIKYKYFKIENDVWALFPKLLMPENVITNYLINKNNFKSIESEIIKKTKIKKEYNFKLDNIYKQKYFVDLQLFLDSHKNTVFKDKNEFKNLLIQRIGNSIVSVIFNKLNITNLFLSKSDRSHIKPEYIIMATLEYWSNNNIKTIDEYKKILENLTNEVKNKPILIRHVTGSHPDKVSVKYTPSESKIDKKDLNWDFISKDTVLSESFILENKDLVNWDYISLYQNLSKSFITKHKDLLNIDNIKKNDKIHNIIKYDIFKDYYDKINNVKEDVSDVNINNPINTTKNTLESLRIDIFNKIKANNDKIDLLQNEINQLQKNNHLALEAIEKINAEL